MNTITKIKKNSKLIPDQYVNIETGELLSSEVKNNITITMKEGTNQFIINSDEYVTFSSEAMIYLAKEFSNVDIARVFKMGNMLKGDCSVISQNNNHPHTSDTLAVKLNMSIDEFYKMVKRLFNKNVLSYCVCAPSGYVQKIYMLNPYIARKRKTINCELSMFFRDITKDGEIKD
jgi:hypothetical protein